MEFEAFGDDEPGTLVESDGTVVVRSDHHVSCIEPSFLDLLEEGGHQLSTDSSALPVRFDGDGEELRSPALPVPAWGPVAQGVEDLAPSGDKAASRAQGSGDPVPPEETPVEAGNVGRAGDEPDGGSPAFCDEDEGARRQSDATIEALEEAWTEGGKEALGDLASVEDSCFCGISASGRTNCEWWRRRYFPLGLRMGGRRRFLNRFDRWRPPSVSARPHRHLPRRPMGGLDHARPCVTHRIESTTCSSYCGHVLDWFLMERDWGVAGSGQYQLSELQNIEAQSIHIIREVAAEFERPVLLFSGGKDSVVMLRLAQKAFWPGRIPFPVMHIDTGHNFTEVLEFRDRCVTEIGATLVVASVQHSIDSGRVAEEAGPNPSRNRLQTRTLLDAINEHRFDAVFGGARRDEEKARAKERVFSFRDEFGQWDPKNQRPELWSLFNGRHRSGEHIRVFPLSDWTELDIWQYVVEEQIDLPSIYFSHRRHVFRRDGMLLAVGPHVSPRDDEETFEATVRYRTVGDMTCTGAVESSASSAEDIVIEVAASRLTERGATRADDRVSEAAMEDRKREGYF